MNRLRDMIDVHRGWIGCYCAALVLTAPLLAQNTSKSDELTFLPVQSNIYLIAGAGGNILVQVGEQGIVLVDSGKSDFAQTVLEKLKTISTKPIRIIVNTSDDSDHIGGNATLSQAGVAIVGGNDFAGGQPQPAKIVAHLNVLNRISAPTGAKSLVPSAGWPEDTYDGDRKEFFINGDAVQIIHVPAAHSDGDSIVYFRRADVISAGEIYVTDGYPNFDAAKGGSISGILRGLNELLDLAVPGANEEDGTLIIPGRGRICDEQDLVWYRDMVTIIHDRVQNLISKGKSLEEIKKANLTEDFDPEYSQAGWSGTMFVEAIYRSLQQKQ